MIHPDPFRSPANHDADLTDRLALQADQHRYDAARISDTQVRDRRWGLSTLDEARDRIAYLVAGIHA